MKLQINKSNIPLGNIKQLYVQHPTDHTKKGLLIPTSDSIQVIQSQDILYCQSDGNYTKIFTRDGKFVLTSKTLKKIEKALGVKDFLRIHQSHLVNVHDIVRVNGAEVELTDTSKIPFSRRKKEVILESLKMLYTLV